MSHIRKLTFFVIMKLVPMATELEMASKRPMYLSSMVFFDAEVVDGKAKGGCEADARCAGGRR